MKYTSYSPDMNFWSVSASGRRPKTTSVPFRFPSAHYADFRSVSRSGRRPKTTSIPFRFPSADDEPNFSPQAEFHPIHEQVGSGPSVDGRVSLIRLPAAE